MSYSTEAGGGGAWKKPLYLSTKNILKLTQENNKHMEKGEENPLRFSFASNSSPIKWRILDVWVCVNGFGKVSTALLLRNIHLSLASNSQAMERGKKRERKQTILIHIFWLGFSATSAEGTFSRSPFNGCVLSNNTIRS